MTYRPNDEVTLSFGTCPVLLNWEYHFIGNPMVYHFEWLPWFVFSSGAGLAIWCFFDNGLIMTRFLLFILLLFFLYTILRYLIKGVLVYRKILGGESGPEELVQDPYCQTYIPRRTAVRKRIAGRMLYFCNQECLTNYLRRDKNDR